MPDGAFSGISMENRSKPKMPRLPTEIKKSLPPFVHPDDAEQGQYHYPVPEDIDDSDSDLISSRYEGLDQMPSKERVKALRKERISEKALLDTIRRLVEMNDDDVRALGRPFLRELISYMRDRQDLDPKRLYHFLGNTIEENRQFDLQDKLSQLIVDEHLEGEKLEKAYEHLLAIAAKETYQEQLLRLKQQRDQLAHKNIAQWKLDKVKRDEEMKNNTTAYDQGIQEQTAKPHWKRMSDSVERLKAMDRASSLVAQLRKKKQG